MRRRWLCIPALSWCGFLALFHGGAAGLACSFDTSYYALTRAKNGIYTGAMTPNTAFTVYFESRRGPVGDRHAIAGLLRGLHEQVGHHGADLPATDHQDVLHGPPH